MIGFVVHLVKQGDKKAAAKNGTRKIKSA